MKEIDKSVCCVEFFVDEESLPNRFRFSDRLLDRWALIVLMNSSWAKFEPEHRWPNRVLTDTSSFHDTGSIVQGKMSCGLKALIKLQSSA